MKEKQFSDIFISPIFGKKILLDEVEKKIYDEIIDLSNMFLIPNQVLNNLIYDPKIKNPLIEGLYRQTYVANLKNLINQKEVAEIAKIFNEHEIEYVFLKGSAINLIDKDYIRHSRDIDILVSRKSLSLAYKLLKEINYSYKDSLVSDNCKYINFSHHLPILSRPDGAMVELHHRITDVSLFNDCPLTKSMLSQYLILNKNNVDIKICDINHLIAHITYHAVLKNKLSHGPIFLYDIKHLKEMIKDNESLNNLLAKMNLDEKYKDFVRYIDIEDNTDRFGVYERFQIKQNNINNPKSFRYFLFTKQGRLDFTNIMIRKFKRNEDLYQTSRYSIKFYLILLIELKYYIDKLCIFSGRDGRI